jgi:hypothetical protein
MKVEFSNSLKTRFVKDYKLPFQVVQEPMFSYYLEELDSHFDTKKKLEYLTQAVMSLGGEEQFFAESNRVKDSIISAVQAKEVYQKLQNDRLDEYNVNTGVKQQDIYNMSNVGRTFISLDLKKANFNVFKMYAPELVLGFDTYEEMVGSVTDFEYFKQSKYLRQVIFGNMLPKKQQKLQKWVMEKLIRVLHEDVGIQMEDFVSASSDEVVFAVGAEGVDKFVDMVERKLYANDETEAISDWVKVEAFTLKSVGDKKFFIKEGTNGKVEFKGIQSYFFMQVYKKYNEQEITDMDKKFYHDGFLATFDKTVFED